MAICKECGYPLQGDEAYCPECGSPVEYCVRSQSDASQTSDTTIICSASAPSYNGAPAPAKTDWAQYFYENAVIGWKAFKKYFCFTGRASRREFWSFWMIFTLFGWFGFAILMIIPAIAVSIRRMHDTGKCGWWSCVPIVCFFLYLKKSDEGPNRYGIPEPAKNLL